MKIHVKSIAARMAKVIHGVRTVGSSSLKGITLSCFSYRLVRLVSRKLARRQSVPPARQLGNGCPHQQLGHAQRVYKTAKCADMAEIRGPVLASGEHASTGNTRNSRAIALSRRK